MKTISDQVAQTLFITLSMKARDYQAKDSILNDRFSYEISQKIDYDINQFKRSFMSFIGTNLRAKYFDDQCVQLSQNLKNPVIVNLGCGLDTRSLRIKERIPNAVFYELDLEEVIDFRKEVLEENTHLIASSMFADKWMDDLESKHPDSEFIFTCEGVLMYFPKEKSKELFLNLHHHFKGYIIADLQNTWMSKNQNKHDVLKKIDASIDNGGYDDLSELEIEGIELIQYTPTLCIDKKRYKTIGLIARLFPFLKNSHRNCIYKIGHAKSAETKS